MLDFCIIIKKKKVGESHMIMQEEIERDYVDTPSAARELKVSDARIRRLCLDGRFEGALKAGRAWLIPKTSLTNFRYQKRGRKIRRINPNKIFIENIIAENNKWKEIAT